MSLRIGTPGMIEARNNKRSPCHSTAFAWKWWLTTLPSPQPKNDTLLLLGRLVEKYLLVNTCEWIAIDPGLPAVLLLVSPWPPWPPRPSLCTSQHTRDTGSVVSVQWFQLMLRIKGWLLSNPLFYQYTVTWSTKVDRHRWPTHRWPSILQQCKCILLMEDTEEERKTYPPHHPKSKS